ncbi:hypothetical protein OGAPHI_001195 [Ogataea philodendri]|uniref:Secreted protein n=1 Tax=Ogataea philodendri TaxID=1378263 RepID=A0A9P8PFH8_9ASCO|nr:uncharacterized protein OGAPHI_001195 [Ogataea philodendri]KAH3670680.1 hypothetical protein OGAPHI_001195 [Ogataea philodendri]
MIQAPLKWTQLAFMLDWMSWSCFVSNVSGSTLEINDDDRLRRWSLVACDVVGDTVSRSGDDGVGNGSTFILEGTIKSEREFIAPGVDKTRACVDRRADCKIARASIRVELGPILGDGGV